MTRAICIEDEPEELDGVDWEQTSICENIPVVIMAGGYGKRLQELTRETPKPMVRVAGRPALDHVVDHLESNGVKKAVFALHYLPHKIRDYCGECRENGFCYQYSVCEEDYGTAGGVLRAALLLEGDPILIVSGDVLTNMDLAELVRFHQLSGGPLTIALTHVDDARRYGVPITNRRNQIVAFEEKPEINPEGGAWVNAGIYVMDRDLLGAIPDNRPFDIARDLIPNLLENGIPIHGCRLPGYWFDIGTPESLGEAENHIIGCGVRLENGRSRIRRRESLNGLPQLHLSL